MIAYLQFLCTLSLVLVHTQTQEFSNNAAEVLPPPLTSFTALERCGEGSQEGKRICVPYYNCNAATDSVILDPKTDGSGKIEIRFGPNDGCAHYLHVCCGNGKNATVENLINSLFPRNPNDTQTTTTTTTATPETTPTIVTVTDIPQSPSFCGLRNKDGLDFNLISGNDNQNRENQSGFAEFPWMVAILRNNASDGQQSLICGASLISPIVVLTGAHCVAKVKPGDIKIRAGEWDTQTTSERIPHQERQVNRIIVHEHYLSQTLYNNVALLILDKPVTKSESVGTVCLPENVDVGGAKERKVDPNINPQSCFATGWGKNNFGNEGQYASILKKVSLNLVEHRKCQDALRTTRLASRFNLHHSFICAIGLSGSDTCTGDGGGPLVCEDSKSPGRFYQVGIVSWGIGCYTKDVPGVYVDVPQFREWVDIKMGELGYRTDSYTT